MQADLIHGAAVFDNLAGEWDALSGRGMTDTPFQSLAYQKAWWTHLGPGNLHTVAVRDDGGQLAAIGCFYLVDDLLYFNGCVEETDYLDLIAPAGHASPAWHTIFDVLESDAFPTWTGLNLCNIPAASPSRDILRAIADARGYAFHTEVQEVCPVITLPGTFDDYLMDLDKKQRHEIRRKLRRAAPAGADVAVVQPEDDVALAVDAFLDLLQLSATEKEDWLNAERRAVFHEVAAAALEAGTLQLLFLTVNGDKAAGLFNFDYNDRIWVYNSGLDPANYGYLSPGVVITARAIEMAIASGRGTFDFLRGDERYKYRFGAEDTTIHRIRLIKS